MPPGERGAGDGLCESDMHQMSLSVVVAVVPAATGGASGAMGRCRLPFAARTIKIWPSRDFYFNLLPNNVPEHYMAVNNLSHATRNCIYAQILWSLVSILKFNCTNALQLGA